eukprot:NODE_920_length_1375_cov_44.720965_g765_i0.p3 GENE.NODE_920_length_1375_cov_44.720965_g765_i0~~NODE_920_length_1375_cov_44.720965_g765_i0.p3  ORF type:complete len:94 (+),score=20.96 NODE_920_length_1375_cov_44.720965_g765_i0:219-500(+)
MLVRIPLIRTFIVISYTPTHTHPHPHPHTHTSSSPLNSILPKPKLVRDKKVRPKVMRHLPKVITDAIPLAGVRPGTATETDTHILVTVGTVCE